jgi:hypothetical protein
MRLRINVTMCLEVVSGLELRVAGRCQHCGSPCPCAGVPLQRKHLPSQAVLNMSDMLFQAG